MTLQFTIQLRTMWKWRKGNIDKISKIGHERADRADSRQAAAAKSEREGAETGPRLLHTVISRDITFHVTS